MSYLIDRQAAIDAIRKEYGGIKNANMDGDFLADEIEFILSKLKPANAVEVVRCKECIHRPYVVPAKYNSRGQCEKYSYIESIDDICPYLCDDAWYNRVPEDNFFCAYGE